MFYILASLIPFWALLILYRPQPKSLHDPIPSYYANFLKVRGTLFLGTSLSIIFLLTSEFEFLSSSSESLLMFGLSNVDFWSWKTPIRLITHSFVHINFVHIVSNICGLALVSAYERKVGHRRFFEICLVSLISAIPSSFFYLNDTIVCGFSGAIFGLGAAFFVDEKELSKKEWLYSVGLFAGIAALFALKAEFEQIRSNGPRMRIDHIGHFLGALGAIVYCRYFSRR